MIAAIETKRPAGYSALMHGFALRLLALLAALMLPLSMAAAPATAHSHSGAPAVGMHHHENQPDRVSHDRFSACSMACSAALPASDFHAVQPLRRTSAPAKPVPVVALRSIELEIATPPPKFS